MNRLSPPILALAAAAAAVLVELLPSWRPLSPLARSPWPWLCLMLLIVAMFGRHRASIVAVVLVGVAALTAHHRAQAVSLTPPGGARWIAGTVSSPLAISGETVRFSLASGGRRLQVVMRKSGEEVGFQPGDRVSLWGHVAQGRTYWTPGVEPPSTRALRAGGHHGLVFCKQDDVHIENRAAVFSLWRLPGRVQRAGAKRIAEVGGDVDGNAIVRALATGDRAGISRSLGESLRRAGVAHLLAVSGLHIAVVSMFVFALTRKLWSVVPRLRGAAEPQVVAAVVALASACLYAAVTGARPSALRALLVAAIAFIGVATYRRPRALDALGAAAFLLVITRPAIVFDPSFQMSVSAALVLCLAFVRREPTTRRAWRLLRAGGNLAWVALLALLATAPTSIALYEELPLVAVPMNVIAVPIVELIVLPLALIGSVVSTVSPLVGEPILALAIEIAGGVAALATWVARSVEPVAVEPLSASELLALGVFVAALIMVTRGCRHRVALFVALVLSASALALLVMAPPVRDLPAGLRVTYLDVGQGDATVIEFPNGAVWLVDAGGIAGAREQRKAESPGRASVVPYLEHRGIDRIDVAYVSHAHPDHYLGFGAIALELPIDRLIVTASDPEQPHPAGLESLLRWLRLQGTRIETPSRRIDVGAATAEVLAPTYGGRLGLDPVSSVNDNSIALRVSYAGRSLLFAGDLEEEGEELALEAHRAALDVDVVKVNHHGSRTSSLPSWVAATSPSLAVISCGRRNRFGFPHAQVLERWQQSGARVLRTDWHGTTTVTISPQGELSTETVVSLPGEQPR